MKEKAFTYAYNGIDIFVFQNLIRPFPAHFHDRIMAGCLLKGSRQFSCDDSIKTIHPGQLVILSPWQAHACWSAGLAPVDWVCMHIETSEIMRFKPCYLKAYSLSDQLAQIGHEILNGSSVSTARLSDLKHEIEGISKTRSQKECHTGHPISEWLQSNCSEQFHLADMAKLAGMKKFTFLRNFKSENSITPHRFLSSLNLAKAQAMLRDGYGLSEIAAASGFYDQSHLNRNFKANIGVTPGAFKKAHSQC